MSSAAHKTKPIWVINEKNKKVKADRADKYLRILKYLSSPCR